MNLNQVTIPSVDLERAIEFYQKLGLNLIVKALPHYARFEVPDGDATFSLHLVDQLPQGEGIAIYFESDRLDVWVEELLAKGIEFEEMPEDRPWLWREARLRDPDGNNLVQDWKPRVNYSLAKWRKIGRAHV